LATKANYPVLRKRAKQSFNGVWSFRFNSASAVAVTAEERRREYETRWAYGGVSLMGAYSDLMFSAEANETAAEFVRGKIREIVHDPEVAKLLSPKIVIGCKRLCVDTDYYATYNRPNVSLIDVSGSPIETITARGVKAKGSEYSVDALILATGFDAMTGALNGIDIRGLGGNALKEKWHGGPRTYLGLMTAGFPNLFTITGPGSPSVLTNMLPSIEQHVDWIAECIGYLRQQGIAQIDATAQAEDDWVAHVNQVGGANLRSSCSSWYVGANIPGKPRIFMPYIGGFPVYVQKCNEIAANGYRGCTLTP
jgi:cation diffusion facilitator CzcD-associated flavoprotein CzcO